LYGRGQHGHARRRIRSQRHLHQLSLRELARMTGISNPYLSQIERGLREPSDTVVGAIADALDLTTERLYDAAGIRVQDEVAAEPDGVREAILADPDLKPQQRRVRCWRPMRPSSSPTGVRADGPWARAAPGRRPRADLHRVDLTSG
jgi:transcriptional regulator with XRE-family HTH domain